MTLIGLNFKDAVIIPVQKVLMEWGKKKLHFTSKRQGTSTCKYKTYCNTLIQKVCIQLIKS